MSGPKTKNRSAEYRFKDSSRNCWRLVFSEGGRRATEDGMTTVWAYWLSIDNNVIIHDYIDTINPDYPTVSEFMADFASRMSRLAVEFTAYADETTDTE